MTSDPNDRATEHEEKMREAAISTSRKPEGPRATGACLYCDAVLPPGLRFCDSICRDDWQKEQR